MAKHGEVERLRQDLSRSPGEGTGRRYSESLRQRAGRLADAERREGRSVDVLAQQLGVSTPALTRWMRDSQGREAMAGPLRPVEIVAEASTGPSRLIVKGPCGVAVEGLVIEQIAELLRSLA